MPVCGSGSGLDCVRACLKRISAASVAFAPNAASTIDGRSGDASDLAEEHDYSIADLSDGAIKKPRVTQDAKYRHTTDKSLAWAELGREPKWITELDKTGVDIESLRVK
ncbi:H-NS family nucleoid-associated regulatory protein [Paracoccus sp. PXZ]